MRRYSFVIGVCFAIYVLSGFRSWLAIRRLAAATASAPAKMTAVAATALSAAAGIATVAGASVGPAAPLVVSSATAVSTSAAALALLLRGWTEVTARYRSFESIWYWPVHALLNVAAERLAKAPNLY